MKTNYNFAITEVLKSEGGYSNDPADSGGETNFGITQRETSIPVKTMNVEQAKAIYKKKYWDAVNADQLENGVDFTVFDYGVNSGVGRAKKVLQQFSSLKGDKLIDAINNERKAFLEGLIKRRPKDEKFRKGWMLRVERVRKQSHQLAGQKDVVTGPAAGATASIGLWATLHNYFSAHPYLSVAAAIAVGAGIWTLVHYLRNRK